MKLIVTSEHDLVVKYVSVVGFLYSLNKRESEVATSFVVAYRNISLIKANQDDQTPEEELVTDVMAVVRSSEVLHDMVKYLDMPFTSFRNYVAKIKVKGFFIKGKINPDFIPGSTREGEIVITR